ncbi:hypothetical protein [Mesorhizobium sp. M0482]|uniref:hypothetical protein n=1 Tax=Mesorhizobium sp. M0482 TaxID=2956948 RepID=UPI00333A0E7A
MKLQYLIGTKPGYGKQLHHARWNILAQLLKAGVRAGLVKLGHDVCDRVTDLRDLEA